MPDPFLHERNDFRQLLEITACLEDPKDRKLFEREYERTAGLYDRDRPSLEQILVRLRKDLDRP
jgi:hypothetical protein